MKLNEALETLKNNGAEVIKKSVEDVYDDIFETIYDMTDEECEKLCYIIKQIIKQYNYDHAEKFKKDLIDMLKGLK